MKIILSGGGTLGPVSPLLAIAEAYKKTHLDAEFLWVGTKNGPEQKLIEEAGIRFVTIGAGKWRRYFSLLNILDLFKIAIAFFQSFALIIREKPDLLISAGGFVSVPLHWAGALLAKPSWVHQQDIEVGFANKLMFPFAKTITVATRDSLGNVHTNKAEWIGNPMRVFPAQDPGTARKAFGIPANAPVIFALGGGTGSTSINQLIVEALPQWPREWHIIHLVGKERPRELSENAATVFPNYHVFTFFTKEMATAYAAADVVVARAGFGTLTELAALRKAAVILPMFDTHQEANARFFAKNDGVVLVDKGMNFGLRLAQTVKELVDNPAVRQALGAKLHDLLPATPAEKIVTLIEETASVKN